VIVAIDGPAGAGKSTVSRALAHRLGMGYLDTGAMYRALTLAALRAGVSPGDGPALVALADAHDVRLILGGGPPQILLDGEDVTDAVRTAPVTAAVSEVSAHGDVRRAMVAQQREVLGRGDWVADGRDIGTAVWPAAEVKIFLTADPGVRAERRLGDLRALGQEPPIEEVRADIERRDHADSTREESPLRQAADAVRLDTSGMTIEDVVTRIARIVGDSRRAS